MNIRLLILLAMIGVALSACSRVEDGKRVEPEQAKLTVAEEAALRAAVYQGQSATAFPTEGPWAMFEILVAPESVMRLRGEKEKAAMAILLDIVKGGRPEDALLAAGFARCLEGNPVSGRTISGRPTKRFDDIVEGLGETPRQQLVRSILKRLDNLEMK